MDGPLCLSSHFRQIACVYSLFIAHSGLNNQAILCLWFYYKDLSLCQISVYVLNFIHQIILYRALINNPQYINQTRNQE